MSDNHQNCSRTISAADDSSLRLFELGLPENIEK